MRILGIDPGTRVVGYGVIAKEGSRLLPVAAGLIRLDPAEPLSQRLGRILRSMQVVIQRARPDVAVLEEIFYGRNVSSLIKIGQARGVLLAACAVENLETCGYPPAEVKRAVTGNGRASKSQVREMVRVLLGHEETLDSEDVSDALAVAICHAHRAGLKERGLMT